MSQRIPIEKIILHILAGVGILAAVAVAPGVGPALRMFGVGKKKYSPRNIDNALYRMKSKGLIEFKEKNGKKFIELTEKGKRKYAEQSHLMVRHNTKPRRWDKRWRIVIFDIPEKYRKSRDKVRYELTKFGFARLQDSVWVYPYDCEELILMLKADTKVGKQLLYIVAERVEYDTQFKHSFDLP